MGLYKKLITELRSLRYAKKHDDARLAFYSDMYLQNCKERESYKLKPYNSIGEYLDRNKVWLDRIYDRNGGVKQEVYFNF